MEKFSITGIVLSGGKSSRLGEEKGLAQFNGRPLISYALNVVEKLCDIVLISANDHFDEYKKFQHPVIPDVVSGIGPMGGISACLEQSTTRLNIIISCDVPFVNVELFNFLIDRIDNYQAALPLHNGFLEPLCGVYATNVLWYLNDFISKGNYKMMEFLKEINCLHLEVDKRNDFFSDGMFANINTPKELKGD